MQKGRRWNAFVCPDCRFVFRVPRDHDGHGIICPSCRRMLRIPGPGENTAPLVAPIRRIGFAKDDVTDRHHKKSKSSSKSAPSILKIIALSLLVLCIIAAIAIFLLKEVQEDGQPASTDPLEVQDDFDELISPAQGE